jgi:hypothetical protein
MKRVQRSRGLRGLVYQLVDTADPALLIELYYWSREPQLARIIRQLHLLPEEARDGLMAFFTLARGSEHTVSITISTDGVLTLSSPQVSEHVGQMARIGSGELSSVH